MRNLLCLTISLLLHGFFLRWPSSKDSNDQEEGAISFNFNQGTPLKATFRKPTPPPKKQKNLVLEDLQEKEQEQEQEQEQRFFSEQLPSREKRMVEGIDFFLRPEWGGGEKDPLNKMEEVYFSFWKRSFLHYVHTFLRTFAERKKSSPSLVQELKDPHFLSARVSFDQKGNLLKIQVIQSSESDEVHSLFEQTLKNLRRIPNPPRDFIDPKGQFVLYYILRLEDPP